MTHFCYLCAPLVHGGMMKRWPRDALAKPITSTCGLLCYWSSYGETAHILFSETAWLGPSLPLTLLTEQQTVCHSRPFTPWWQVQYLDYNRCLGNVSGTGVNVKHLQLFLGCQQSVVNTEHKNKPFWGYNNVSKHSLAGVSLHLSARIRKAQSLANRWNRIK